LGFQAGGGVFFANNVICIGAIGSDVSNTTWIGNVYGVTTQSGTTAPVVVPAGGQLGTVATSERSRRTLRPCVNVNHSIMCVCLCESIFRVCIFCVDKVADSGLKLSGNKLRALPGAERRLFERRAD